MLTSGMRYQIEMQQNGWRIRDDSSDVTARFGAIVLDHLTLEEAHVMLSVLEARDRQELQEGPPTEKPREGS